MSQPHSTQQTGFSTLSRPHTISAAFSAQHAASRPQITSATFLAPEAAVATTTANSVPVSPTKQQQQQQQQRANASLFEQSYSTIKRVYRCVPIEYLSRDNMPFIAILAEKNAT